VALAPVYGLVMAGGHSSRMGMDKALIYYHDCPQWKYMTDLFPSGVDRSFLSIRSDQQEYFAGKAPYIVDAHTEKGPMGGIWTAQQAFPDVAWLVLGIDLPLLTTHSLTHLLSQRSPQQLGISLCLPTANTYEPMASLWEPQSGKAVATALAEGKLSLRRLMQQLHFARTPILAPGELHNANTPEEQEAIKRLLKGA